VRWARGAVRIARRELAHRLGLGEVEPTDDRRWLEGQWLPRLAQRDDVRTVLFVGVRWYTRHYASLVPGKRFVTLDVDPRAARFGNGSDHVVGDAREVASLLHAGSIDSVVFNGVFGWGLDDSCGLARALDGLADVLRPRGELLFGWNDVPRRCPFDWQALPVWRERFEPLASPVLGDAPLLSLPTDNRHCFALFAKRV
jgi:SAM-dependent methyltransferase